MESSMFRGQAVDAVQAREHDCDGEMDGIEMMAGENRARLSSGNTRGDVEAIHPEASYFDDNDDRSYSHALMARRNSPNWRTGRSWTMIFIIALGLCCGPTLAVFVDFQNCLTEAYQKNTPRELQFVPLFVDAVFNTTDPAHNLAVRVWGNVTGSTNTNPLPPANDTSYWSDNSTTDGKIVDKPDPSSAQPKLTTLASKINVVTYEPWNNFTDFCDALGNATCPLPPSFSANASNPYTLPYFGLSHDFSSSYAFTTFTVTFLIKNGDLAGTNIGCISASITPDLGDALTASLRFLPLMILICVGFATAFAAVYSPWGSADIFEFTTNYGRDADLLRLVTPGFGDCLQHIQFIVLTGALTLSYPGFYPVIVSKVSWAVLMFPKSFVSKVPHVPSLVDGIYATHGNYGLDRLRQLVGMNAVDDIWAGMAIWLLIIIGAVLILTQVGFFVNWFYRRIINLPQEDLRAKNTPFSLGNVIRIVFNYFLLPIVAISMFQLVVAAKSPAFTVALGALMIVLVVGFAAWLLYLIGSTRPKSVLFDDLSTVLLYGSLYNTYSDDAAPFALVPVLLTILRGIAIGAMQSSGIAQLVLLAICEIIFVLTLHAFRPFHSPTSMIAYHTFFAVLRITTVLLMIAFAPSLGVTDGPKGWIGYIILLIHGIVLIFGFFLNAIQTIVEVGARMAGAGREASSATRGGLIKVFGIRQLSKRLPRHNAGSRQSQLSSAAMLDVEGDRRSFMMDGGRFRSQSAGSGAILLNRTSTGLDGIEPHGAMPGHHVGSGTSSYGPTTPGDASTFSFLPSARAPSGLGQNRGPISSTPEAADPWWYRPPRLRRPTNETFSPAGRSRGSWISGMGDPKDATSSPQGPASPEDNQPFEGPSISGRATPIQQVGTDGRPQDGSPVEIRQSKADYTTREVDFYYGIRGPALNANLPNRRTKTGPSDPTGIPASAAGWFKGLFGGKTKEKGKGFEVVRSARMPPGMVARNTAGEETPPEGIPVATGGARHGPIDSDDEFDPATLPRGGPPRVAGGAAHERDNLVNPIDSDNESQFEGLDPTRISDIPPSLPGIEVDDDGIELPSRFPSKATSKASSRREEPREEMTDIPLVADVPSRVPTVPRKSSKRKSLSADLSNSALRQVLQQHPEEPFDGTHHAS